MRHIIKSQSIKGFGQINVQPLFIMYQLTSVANVF